MRIWKVYGRISSFWNGTTEDYYSSEYATKKRAEEEAVRLREVYSRHYGYDASFKVFSIKVIE